MSKVKPISASFHTAFTETNLGHSGLRLNSSFVKAATYEGMVDNGIPNKNLIDHHVSMVKGGVGMTTVAYGAVSSDGRTFKEQMSINEASLEVLKELAEKVHGEGGKVSMQLTHCGYFSKNKASKSFMAPSRIFNAYGFLSGLVFSKAMNEEELERVALDFANSARALQEIGFDAVEIHLGHGYLLSQFLSPLTNKRKDRYGGSINNRSRYPLYVVDKVIKTVGPDFPVLVKLNLDDGIKGGFSLTDCIFVSKKLEEIGCTAIVLSGGFTSKSPFYLLRGKVPFKGMIKNASSVAEKLTMGILGPAIIRKYHFKENFFLDKAIQVRKEVTLDLIYLGGVDSKIGMENIFSKGFNFIALARPLIHDPEFLLKIKDGIIDKSGCNRCNECIVEMDRKGVKCVLN
ncbi:MAG: NADH:flavin oxidoreductase [Flavobacteriaceae bacterium]|nr:MAG: NADH:flavin oxidoreductase [Flavobacteriaceae bacterium]